jgi:hypothetical protein
MTNTDWEKIKGEIAVAAALDWPAPAPLCLRDMTHALMPVIERAMLAGQTIGIRETADNARKQFRGMNAPTLVPYGS